MSYALNNVATADAYPKDGEGASLIGEHVVRLMITVANAAVYYQLAKGRGNWQEEHFKLPSIYSLERRCDGIRFRSGAAGVPARVSVEAATKADLS